MCSCIGCLTHKQPCCILSEPLNPYRRLYAPPGSSDARWSSGFVIGRCSGDSSGTDNLCSLCLFGVSVQPGEEGWGDGGEGGTWLSPGPLDLFYRPELAPRCGPTCCHSTIQQFVFCWFVLRQVCWWSHSTTNKLHAGPKAYTQATPRIAQI